MQTGIHFVPRFASILGRCSWANGYRRYQLTVARLPAQKFATESEIIRAIIQRIESGPAKVAIVLQLPAEPSARGLEPIIANLSRA